MSALDFLNAISPAFGSASSDDDETVPGDPSAGDPSADAGVGGLHEFLVSCRSDRFESLLEDVDISQEAIQDAFATQDWPDDKSLSRQDVHTVLSDLGVDVDVFIDVFL